MENKNAYFTYVLCILCINEANGVKDARDFVGKSVMFEIHLDVYRLTFKQESLLIISEIESLNSIWK